MAAYWYTIIGIVLLVYIALNIIAYFSQELFLFKPEKLPADFAFKYDNQVFEEHNIELGKGININGIHFRVKNPKGVVIYLKGNSRSIKGWGKFSIDFTRLGFDVVMVDYRGFGKSTGKRTEDGIKKDLQQVYDIVKSQVREKYIVLYGRSLGSGFATKLASMNNPRMLILEAPYYSMQSITKRYLPIMPMSILLRFPIKTYKWIKYVKCPIHIIHGTEDSLIPMKSSIKLSSLNKEHCRLYPVIGGKHNTLHSFEQYHLFLEEILFSKLPQKINENETSLSFDIK